MSNSVMQEQNKEKEVQHIHWVQGVHEQPLPPVVLVQKLNDDGTTTYNFTNMVLGR